MNDTSQPTILETLRARPHSTPAPDLVVMISGGFRSSYQALAPAFEQAAGVHLTMAPGPSEGETHDAITQRLDRGEPADVLIMVGAALQKLEQKAETLLNSAVNLALSPIGCAVRESAPVPDISTIDKLKQALLNAKSIAYSDSASGDYLKTTLIKKLGIEKEMSSKARQIPATPTGEIVAKGQADLGFQEVAELLPIKGIKFAGRLPSDVQHLTMFAGAVAQRSKHPELAKDLLTYLSSHSEWELLKKEGLEPPK